MVKFGVGQAVTRVEDDRLITGQGRYTDDIAFTDQAYAVFVRSPHAHARILSIDTGSALEAPGVFAVYTSADCEADGLGEVPNATWAAVKNPDGSPAFKTTHPLLATERVRYTGDPVAMVVAATPGQARDAADLVMVDYDDLPVIADTAAAVAPDAPVIWDELGSNQAFDWRYGDDAAYADAAAQAAHVTRIKLINNRIVVNTMEPRSAVALYDADKDHYTFYVGSQGVHSMRQHIAQHSLKIAPEKIRVVTGDVGGGFGMKMFVYGEYPLVMYAARKLGRPVKWTADRAESFLSDAQGRDHVTQAALALDKDGHILGVKVDTIANLGAYEAQFGCFIPTLAQRNMHVGVYKVPAYFNRVRAVLTNTVPVDAYRGAGRPEASYVIERLMDQAARELRIDPAELRRRNFIQPNEMPYEQAPSLPIDSGDFDRNLTDALKFADWDGFEARRASSARRGLVSGIGLAYYVERTAGGMTDFAHMRVAPEGIVHIYPGTQSNGQGHETAWAQYVVDKLGVAFEKIKVHSGDTDTLAQGGGTGGSKSLYMAAGALSSASDALIEKGKVLAANELEAATADIEYRGADGEAMFVVAGTDRVISLFDVARIAETQADAGELSADGEYVQEKGTYPNGAHICEVDIDPETGMFKIVRYTVVDDFGHVVNPLLVAGQVHGGIVQGLGQAMGENAVYDPETGQLLTGSFMDYWMPRADDMPFFDFHYNEIPSPTNALGVKGAGEAGTVGAPAAFINAIINALSQLGIASVDMPVTPARLWQLIQEAKAAA